MNFRDRFEEAQYLRNNNLIDQAVERYKDIREEVKGKDNKLAIECAHMIGVSYYQIKNWDKAKVWLKKAKIEVEDQKDLLLLGAVLRDLALVARGEKNFIEAEDYLIESINILKKEKNLGHLGISEVKLGILLAEKGGDLEQAEETIREGLEHIKLSPDRFFEVIGYVNLAEVLMQAKKNDLAEDSLKEGLRILDQISDKDQNKGMREKIEAEFKKLNNGFQT